MSQFVRTLAIVLRRTNFNEADRIITFLTPQGQITGLAKGVRKAKSKLAGGLEPFSLTDLVLARGKNGFYHVTGANLITYFQGIITRYDRLELGYNLLKNVNRLSRDIAEPNWFVILRQALVALDNPMIDLRLIKAWFNFQAAKVLGEELNLEQSVDGQQLKLSQNYNYDPQSKSFIKDDQGKVSANVLKLLKALNSYDLLNCNRIVNVGQYLDLVLRISIGQLGLE